MASYSDPRHILRQYWGYETFRPLQEDIVRASLEGKDVLALLPTGGGKSVCFQVPALAKEGICLVVSPLIALMKDQVAQLNRRDIAAVAIYSGMKPREIDITLDNCVYGNIKFLYVSPERLKTELFRERLQRMNVNLIAIDEAHCISQWGYDFRPPYLEIAELRELLPEVPVIALTATATPEVRDDIRDKLAFRTVQEVFRKSFARANLSYSVRYEDNKDGKLLEILRVVKGSAVVYVRSRKRTQQIAQWLTKQGISADYYHAGLSNEQRDQKQDAWIKSHTRVIVATNAFGMGIDKPDVRVVAHMDLPDTLEAYYQEAGRAGRDEKKAYAVVLYNQDDLEALRSRVQQAYPSIDYLRRVYQCLANYYKIAVGSSQMESYDFDLQAFAHTYRLQALEAYHALKKLEEEGFIQLNESFYQPSRAYFTMDNRDLYRFQIEQGAYDPLIKALLRHYGGELFSTFVKIDERQLGGSIDKPAGEVVRMMNFLHEREVLIYDPKKDRPQVTFITARFDSTKLPIDKELLDQRRKLNIDKAESVITYVTHHHRCRTQILLEYFGEINDDRCGVCDICVEEKKAGKLSPETEKEAEEAIINLLSNNGPLLPDQVKEKLQTARLSATKAEAFTLSLRHLIEEGRVKYDEMGRLRLS
ncbi:ATP-dependent DNA helicase RecQ [Roseivirga sp. BDSF3-8]|uniref:RecQ family ATP-dependent DNA helicase n=1 Tax=Roseivirga sp. BDSF3-8 TaxID=3241598 RepID=UPI0035326AC2